MLTLILPDFRFWFRRHKIRRYFYLLFALFLFVLFLRKEGRIKFRITEKPINYKMDDVSLIQYVRDNCMKLESKDPYNMENMHLENASIVLTSNFMGTEHFWTDAIILAEKIIPKEKQTKKFFECGASDGEFMSQTYFAERFLNWTGLLVEADPFYFEKMLRKNRKAMHLGACASTTKKSSVLSFLHVEKLLRNGNEYVAPGIGRIFDGTQELPEGFQHSTSQVVEVFCVPVYTMLLAANLTRLDIFFLDIEGPEVDVLMTIPFDKVDIAIFVVEHNSIPQRLHELEVLFHERGYALYESSPVDSLFVKREYLKGEQSGISTFDLYGQFSYWNDLPARRA